MGTICFVCAALCIILANYPEAVGGGAIVPVAFMVLTFAGASLAIVDVVRKRRLSSAVLVCIANLGLLLPYMAIRAVVTFLLR